MSNVTLFDLEADGVVSVRFTETDAAEACVKMMDGRFFGGTQVEANIADGSERFRKTNPKKAALEEELKGQNGNENEEEKRLEKFGSWLEGESKGQDDKQQQE